MACEQAVLSFPSCFTSSISIKEMLVYIEAAAYLALVYVSFRSLSLVDEKKRVYVLGVCVCVLSHWVIIRIYIMRVTRI